MQCLCLGDLSLNAKYAKQGLLISYAKNTWYCYCLVLSSVQIAMNVSENRQYEMGQGVELVINNDNGKEPNGN